MNMSMRRIVEDVVIWRLSARFVQTNHDVYDKRLRLRDPPEPFNKTPRCIYFYYVRIDTDGMVLVDHYLYIHRNSAGASIPLPYDDVPGVLETLAINARPSTVIKNPPKDPSNDFKPFPWTYRSYIAIYFDEANWKLHKRANGKAAIVFDPVLGEANCSFFDAQDVELDMPVGNTGDFDKRSAIYFVNHMKSNSDGDDLGNGDELGYKFDIWLDATYANSGLLGMSVNFDPGGTNQGPPQDPP